MALKSRRKEPRSGWPSFPLIRDLAQDVPPSLNKALTMCRADFNLADEVVRLLVIVPDPQNRFPQHARPDTRSSR
jgi:hypothetical protein